MLRIVSYSSRQNSVLRRFWAAIRAKILGQEDSKLQVKSWGAKYDNEKEISPSDLTAFPPFLRFGNVELDIADSFDENDAQPIADKCLLFENLLQSVKPPALARSALFFSGAISESMPSCFHDHLELLNYLRDRLLPICNTSRAYEFCIIFDSDQSAAKHVIASILQTPQLDRCSSVHFDFFCFLELQPQLRLPVKEISNWLHLKCDRERKKSLRVNLDGIEIENSQEMIDHLQEVFYFVKF